MKLFLGIFISLVIFIVLCLVVNGVFYLGLDGTPWSSISSWKMHDIEDCVKDYPNESILQDTIKSAASDGKISNIEYRKIKVIQNQVQCRNISSVIDNERRH